MFFAKIRPRAYTGKDGSAVKKKKGRMKMDKNQNGMPILPDMGGCESAPMLCDGVQLAMVYAPMQSFRKLYSEADALRHGTLFEELYKPLEEV